MSQKLPLSIQVSRVEEEADDFGTYSSFCTARINIKKESPREFNILMKSKSDSKGVIFVPCLKYSTDSVEGISKAIKVYDSNGEKTPWSIEFEYNSIEKNTGLKFRCDSSPDLKDDCTIELCAVVLNFDDFEFYLNTEGSEDKLIQVEGGSSPSRCDSVNSERFKWVKTKVDEIFEKQQKLPQFHVKQVSTLTALKKLKSKEIATVTYVGPDDVANLLTCFNELKDRADPSKVEIIFRRQRNEDTLAETNWLKNKLANLGFIKEYSERDHHDNWDKCDLIVDTYTAMFWGSELASVREEIKNRVDCLKQNGELVLVFPIKVEHFNGNLETNLADQIEEVIDETLLQEVELKKIATNSIGNSRYVILQKQSLKQDLSENITTNDSAPKQDFFIDQYTEDDDVNDSSQKQLFRQTERTEKFIDTDMERIIDVSPSEAKIPNALTSTTPPIKHGWPTKINSWEDYVRACRNKNPASSPARPFYIEVIDEIADTIQDVTVEKNIILIQTHPGWGKTSIVGEALFPERNPERFRDLEIWFGNLEELENYSTSDQIDVGLKQNSVLILDDLHDEVATGDKAVDKEEIVTNLKKISSRVKLVIITCRLDEWNNVNLDTQIPDISHVFSRKLIPSLNDADTVSRFITHLVTRANCKVEKGDPMYKESLKWAQYIQSQIFSVDNLVNQRGRDRHPRWGIRYLQDRKIEFEDPNATRNDQGEEDDDEFSIFR